MDYLSARTTLYLSKGSREARSPVIQAEQDARIRAQHAAAAAQDTHEKIQAELDHVQRQISQISPSRNTAEKRLGTDRASFEADGGWDVIWNSASNFPMVTLSYHPGPREYADAT